MAVWFAAPPSVRPTFKAFAAAASSPMRCWPRLPTVSTEEPAMQRSPAQPNAAFITPSTVLLTSESGSTTTKFLAPPLACTRLPCAEAVWWM